MFDTKLISKEQRQIANATYRDLRRYKQKSRIVDNPLPPSSNVGQVVRSTNGAYGSVGKGMVVVGHEVLLPVGWVDGQSLEATIAALPWATRYLLTRIRRAPRNGRHKLPTRLISNQGGFQNLQVVPLALACLALHQQLEVMHGR
jgi:hypothetical protein